MYWSADKNYQLINAIHYELPKRVQIHKPKVIVISGLVDVLRENKAILNHGLSQHGFKRQFKLSFEIMIYIRRYYYWTILTNYFMASTHFWHIPT